ncbi:MAG: hypothetical protein V4636_09085 [Pseudomonadota bacterium]
MSANQPWSEQYRVVAKAWVDAEAAASLLEDTKSAVLAERMAALGEMPVSKAEMTVKASKEWRDDLRTISTTRQAANRLKVQLEYIRMKFMEWQSENATKRAEMRL